MTNHEEIYLISQLLSKSEKDGYVELNNEIDFKDYFLNENTKLHEDYFYELNQKSILKYEQILVDDAKVDTYCYVTANTSLYLKDLINKTVEEDKRNKQDITILNNRINEILTFNPQRLSNEIKSIEGTIIKTKAQLNSNPILQPLASQLDKVEAHFKSLSVVANNYEEVYKNIILPVKEEGKSGVRQTVKWAIISIIVSTIFSILISWLTK